MFRKLTPADRDAYLSMTRDFYASEAVLHPIPEDHLTRTFAEAIGPNPYVEGWLWAEEDGAPAGYALLAKTWSQEFGGLVIWLEELYTRPEARGRGYARAFLAHLRRAYPEARAFRLEVEPDNQRAKALYQRLGFRAMGYESMAMKAE